MARYDVYPSPDGKGYLIDVQTDLLSGLETRIAVPLLPVAEAPKVARYLNPIFEMSGEPYMLATQYMAAVPERVLRGPIANVSGRGDDVTRALDTIFQGF